MSRQVIHLLQEAGHALAEAACHLRLERPYCLNAAAGCDRNADLCRRQAAVVEAHDDGRVDDAADLAAERTTEEESDG